MRADAGLAKLLGVSRTRAAELTQAGVVQMNGETIGKSDLLRAGVLEITTTEVERPEPEVVPVVVPDLGILYEDEHMVVVDKPALLAAHPSVGWEGDTVLGALAGLGIAVSTSGAAERQGIVQRLDVGTSGVMAVAKSERAYSVLKQAFRDRTPKKIYHALVAGHVDPMVGTIDAPIGRHPGSAWKFAVVDGGRDSITHYEVIEMLPGASLVEVELETGRTHQIRVHMSALGHPCLGDRLYGADANQAGELGLERQWLHALQLEIDHPITGKLMTFDSPYSQDLENSLEQLRDRYL